MKKCSHLIDKDYGKKGNPKIATLSAAIVFHTEPDGILLGKCSECGSLMRGMPQWVTFDYESKNIKDKMFVPLIGEDGLPKIDANGQPKRVELKKQIFIWEAFKITKEK